MAFSSFDEVRNVEVVVSGTSASWKARQETLYKADGIELSEHQADNKSPTRSEVCSGIERRVRKWRVIEDVVESTVAL